MNSTKFREDREYGKEIDTKKLYTLVTKGASLWMFQLILMKYFKFKIQGLAK